MSLFAKARIPKRRALPCCGVSPLNNLYPGSKIWDADNQLVSYPRVCKNCGHEHSRSVSGVSIIHAPIFKEHSS